MFFVTIHCARPGAEQLTVAGVARPLLESVALYHTNERWFAHLFLLMPDHAHALLSFPKMESMGSVVADWKRYTARAHGVVWQSGFFDHRIRGGENWQNKADYIRANPVRKGFIARAEDWPWKFEA